MKIIKPKNLSLVSRTYYLKEHIFSLGILGFFSLSDNRQKNFISEQAGWSGISKILRSGVILDAGYPKSQGEFLLSGSAFSTGGFPVQSTEVSVSIADIKKGIVVKGNRNWNGRLLRAASEPDYFSVMPLKYSKSYGGKGYAENPTGKGYCDRSGQDQGDIDLPNLYLKGESAKADRHLRTPVSFEPVDNSWPQRMKFHGTFNKKWLDNIHPGFPDDTDINLFNSAVSDQWINGYFRPGDEYSLRGMHPDKPVINGYLPDFQARGFVKQKTQDLSVFKEIKTVIDTVWFFPDLDIGVVIYRGKLPVSHSDGLDIDQLLLAYERIGDNARPIEYYERVLTLKTDPQTAAGHLLNDSQLMPQKTPEEETENRRLYHQAEKSLQERKEKKIKLLLADKHLPEDVSGKIIKRLQDKEIDRLPAMPKELIKRGEIDLSSYFERAKALSEQARQTTELKRKQLNTLKPVECTESLSSLKVRVFQPFHPLPADQIKQQVMKEARSCYPDMLITEASDLPIIYKQRLAEYLRKNSRRQVRQKANSSIVESVSVSEDGRKQLRQWTIDLLREGESLAGRDLAGADLNGLDFSGLNLTDLMLEGANLQGTCFDDTVLDGAVLTGAVLDGASFIGASLQKANLSGIISQRVNFISSDLSGVHCVGSSLTDSDFQKAVMNRFTGITSSFENSNFSEVQCELGQFLQANLCGSQWLTVSICTTNFTQSNMTGSVWKGANLSRCIMVEVEASQVSFQETQGKKVQFSTKGNLSFSDFSKSRWETCGFNNINMKNIIADKSVFIECDFSETDLSGSTISSGLFHKCIMRAVNFDDSKMDNQMLSACRMNYASFRNARMQDIRLRHCDTSKSDYTGCRMKAIDHLPQASII